MSILAHDVYQKQQIWFTLVYPKAAMLTLISTIIILVFFCSANAFAICNLPATPAGIQITYSKYADVWANSNSPYSINSVEYKLNWQGDSWQAKHDYLILDFPYTISLAPITNGHLHTLAIGYRSKHKTSALGVLYWELIPTLAVSSNIVKNLDQIRLSTFRLDAHLLWQYHINAKRAAFVGICSAALAGKYKLIPVAGLAYQYSDWDVSVAYPNSEIKFRLDSSLTIYSDWRLAGKQWQVLDSNLQNRSPVTLKSQQLRLGFRIRYPIQGYIEIYWSRFYGQQLQYLARDGTRRSASIDNRNGWMIGYRYFL